MIETATMTLVVIVYLYRKQAGGNSAEVKSLVKARNYPEGLLRL